MEPWKTLDDLEPGSLFQTRDGVLAVKSEYRYPNGQWECVLLASGEYAHFAERNAVEVRAVDIAGLLLEKAQYSELFNQCAELRRENGQLRRERAHDRGVAQ